MSGWVKHRLEDYGASKLMADANEKNKRKEERNNMKASRMGTPGEDMYTYDSSSSTGGGMGMGDDDSMHIPSSAAAAAAAGMQFQADPFLSRPIATKGPPPPNLPFADPISTSKGKAPNISSLHFAQPISFDNGGNGEKNGGRNVEKDTSNINWHQTVDDGDFWDDVDDVDEQVVESIDSSHLSSIHHRSS